MQQMTKIHKISLLPLMAVTVMSMIAMTACQTTTNFVDVSPDVKQQAIEQKIEQQEIEQQEITVDDEQQSLKSMLAEHDWQLVSAVDSQQQEISVLTRLSEPATLSFSQQSISFGVGCNSNGGAYQLAENVLSVGMIMSTQMYCSNLHRAESKLNNLMSGDSELSINNPQLINTQLIQTTADGSTLIWQGELTDNAKYGEGETIFLEIAPQTEDCSTVMNRQCLKVREIYYDDNWIKSGYGDWQLFGKPIEGYRHNDNFRQVLRIKKYVTDPVDVKGKQLLYVLDMAVETELVK